VAAVFDTAPVDNGVRSTSRGARKVFGVGGHCRLVPAAPTAVQLPPLLAPPTQTLLTHGGQGEAAFPVR